MGIPKQGHTKLDIKFKSYLHQPIIVILYATFPETVEIDGARNVKLEEKNKK